eukprot:6214694-Pleurochrysis_carterae.AAC.2
MYNFWKGRAKHCERKTILKSEFAPTKIGVLTEQLSLSAISRVLDDVGGEQSQRSITLTSARNCSH